jgi:hypothetical protein
LTAIRLGGSARQREIPATLPSISGIPAKIEADRLGVLAGDGVVLLSGLLKGLGAVSTPLGRVVDRLHVDRQAGLRIDELHSLNDDGRVLDALSRGQAATPHPRANIAALGRATIPAPLLEVLDHPGESLFRAVEDAVNVVALLLTPATAMTSLTRFDHERVFELDAELLIDGPAKIIEVAIHQIGKRHLPGEGLIAHIIGDVLGVCPGIALMLDFEHCEIRLRLWLEIVPGRVRGRPLLGQALYVKSDARHR